VFILFTYSLYVTEYGVQTFGAKSDEIHLMAFYLLQNCMDVSLKTLLSNRQEICIITND